MALCLEDYYGGEDVDEYRGSCVVCSSPPREAARAMPWRRLCTCRAEGEHPTGHGAPDEAAQCRQRIHRVG